MQRRQRWIPLVCAALLTASCATGGTLTGWQRQAVETREFRADYPQTFRATRAAILNEVFLIENAEFDGGLIYATREVQ